LRSFASSPRTSITVLIDSILDLRKGLINSENSTTIAAKQQANPCDCEIFRLLGDLWRKLTLQICSAKSRQVLGNKRDSVVKFLGHPRLNRFDQPLRPNKENQKEFLPNAEVSCMFRNFAAQVDILRIHALLECVALSSVWHRRRASALPEPPDIRRPPESIS